MTNQPQPTKPYHDMKCAWYPIDQPGSPFSDDIMAVLDGPSGEPWASCVIGGIYDDPAKNTSSTAGVLVWLRAEGRAWAAFRKHISRTDEEDTGPKAMAILDELRADPSYDYVRISL
jgi:hypothetical protein